jgi:REP element-mobilizing transposase RayT
MARSHVNQFSEFPYHITGRILNRESFRLPLARVWLIMAEQLWLACHVDGLKIHSFVLMPNHFHLIATTSTNPLFVPMERIMRDTSKELNLETQRMNQNWGGRHYKCVLTSYHYFSNTYKYVYQNPVRANLCKRVEDWPFSTLGGLLGHRHSFIPVQEDTILFNENRLDETALHWLNQPIQKQDLSAMRMALVKKQFSLSKGTMKKHHKLENHLI